MTTTIYQKEIRQYTKEYAIEIIKFVNYLKSEKIDYALRDQLLRSGTSIGANVIEAKSSSSRSEYIRFYEITLRSSNETEYWLELINEIYHFEERAKLLIIKIQEIKKIIGSIVLKLKSTLK